MNNEFSASCLAQAGDEVPGIASDMGSRCQAQSGSHVSEIISDIGRRCQAQSGSHVSEIISDIAPRLNLAPDCDTVRSNRLPFSTVRYVLGTCKLGAILVAVAPEGICAILLGDAGDALVADLQRRFPQVLVAESGFAPAFAAGMASVLADVIALVEAPHTSLALPLAPRGTPFQQRVWQALRQIPVGRTVSYAELASIVGVLGGARAVAGACAANALAVAIPCHRVLRSDGALSGYRWGVARKQALLECEAAWLSASDLRQ